MPSCPAPPPLPGPPLPGLRGPRGPWGLQTPAGEFSQPQPPLLGVSSSLCSGPGTNTVGLVGLRVCVTCTQLCPILLKQPQARWA